MSTLTSRDPWKSLMAWMFPIKVKNTLSISVRNAKCWATTAAVCNKHTPGLPVAATSGESLTAHHRQKQGEGKMADKNPIHTQTHAPILPTNKLIICLTFNRM
ncbi:hypothetical protein JRQ81_017413 [Phrynocephalus forsythii]|uniref:Uncharacterized protein n=1 Tax=Phrynocephalus forsythii TaxID=171643 RepID=A0A9Q0XQX4_9SAUR|nr:hypothetical protein JRQ81_017413 [Phrynocephalus forsythii]